MSFKRYSDATLMGMTKAELVDYVRMCEHNREAAEQTLAQHIENVKDWEPVRHGRWIETTSYGIYECSECHGEDTDCSDYYGTHDVKSQEWCPLCGARMGG